MLSFHAPDLQEKLKLKTGKDASKIRFHSFDDLERNGRAQVERIRSSPFLPKEIPVTGFVNDVRNGRLDGVT